MATMMMRSPTTIGESTARSSAQSLVPGAWCWEATDQMGNDSAPMLVQPAVVVGKAAGMDGVGTKHETLLH
jgi:hypothetical protein